MPFGIYLHIPFCARRCDYCAFATWTDRGHLVDAYMGALRADVRRGLDDPAHRVPPEGVTSVFVGGGTPSLVPSELLLGVLEEIPLAPGAEVTVECNPDDLNEELARSFRSGGVNRISLGVQSMVPSVLESLGRTHGVDNVTRAVEAVRAAGFPTFNLDLIYGAAGETLDDWATTLAAVAALAPPHVSAYGLTVEQGTPLATEPHRHPDDDDQADKYELVDEAFMRAGLGWYEVSNWAKPGHECRHNQLYWSQGDYLGFGCAAHSHVDGRRWWNVRTPDRYIDLVGAGASVEAAGELLEGDDRRLEGLQLALRMRTGVPAWALDALELPGLVDAIGAGPDTRLVLTRAGRLLANEVALRLRVRPDEREAVRGW
jgi:putative oxygen-independent coproporphyrinogen III oxidase